jgi:GH25 family lysozyme M1 (1,4-beta-N-acetylmuramidase)
VLSLLRNLTKPSARRARAAAARGEPAAGTGGSDPLIEVRRFQPGVDVSGFQGPPADWTAGAGSITWAAVKLTELEPNGTRYVNPDAAADWDWLHANKKGRVAYLFGHPSVGPRETVAFFLTELDRLGLADSDAVALDLEVSEGKTAAEVAAWGAQVQAELKNKLDRPPLLYTFRDFATEGNCAGLGRYPLWIADPSSPAGKPQVPEPWKSWAIHQYDISGSIDRDVANYRTQAEMFAALGKTPPKDPDMQNLGGNLVTAVATARWPDGWIVVAGLGANGFVQANLWDGAKWGGWKNVSPTKANGAPALTAFDDVHGRLYYIDEASDCIQLETGDRGKTWR